MFTAWGGGGRTGQSSGAIGGAEVTNLLCTWWCQSDFSLQNRLLTLLKLSVPVTASIEALRPCLRQCFRPRKAFCRSCDHSKFSPKHPRYLYVKNLNCFKRSPLNRSSHVQFSSYRNDQVFKEFKIKGSVQIRVISYENPRWFEFRV
jgi:hypothetical protein